MCVLVSIYIYTIYTLYNIGLREPQLIRLDQETQLSKDLRIGYFLLRSNEKVAALLYLVRSIIPEDQLTIVFTATKHHSEYIHGLLQKLVSVCM